MNRQSVPNRWHIKFRRRGITQKKAYIETYKAVTLISELLVNLIVKFT